jgi:hypothetical protein
MFWTEENVVIVNEVYAILTKNGCTIETAKQILSFVSRNLDRVSKAQPYEFDFYEDQ